jgi:MoxR-like ATPase
MNLFHMQLHPDEAEDALTYANAALKHDPPTIGLGFDAGHEFDRSLKTFTREDFSRVQQTRREMNNGRPGVTSHLENFSNLKMGDFGLIRGGATPLALVRINGPYDFKIDPVEPLWFKHRFPVRVVGWFEQDLAQHPQIRFTPVARGTFQVLRNVHTPMYRSLCLWLQLKETDMRFTALESAITKFKNLILTGPPGTGKTLHAKRLAAYILTNAVPDIYQVDKVLENLRMPSQKNQQGAWDIVQFHPSYNYDDFVRGIRIRTNDQNQTAYTVEDGPLLKMADAASHQADQKFVLIIDEINRANVAAVLGEMIYALEYRGHPVALQYEKGNATAQLPKNLYIIGTMNTADRSIGHIDYAVRRRFAFVSLNPDRTVVEEISEEDLRIAALAKFDAVASLFTGNETMLSADYRAEDVQPGHSYFLAEDQPDLNQRMRYQVGPLLREYIADGVLKMGAMPQIVAIEGGIL